MIERAEILSLLDAWGFTPEMVGGIHPVLDVFRIETAVGPMSLKWSRRSGDRLLSVARGLEYVSENGFRSCRLPLPTKSGAPFLAQGGRHYLLFEWIEGERIDFSCPEQLAASCRTLAHFHLCGRGFDSSGGSFARLVRSLARRHRELQSFAGRAGRSEAGSGFERELGRALGYYLELAAFGRRLLAGIEPEAGATGESGLCHGDVAARNLILSPGGEVFLIDFDAMRPDLPLLDLWKLFRRAMTGLGWEAEAGLRIIDSYETVAPLRPGELAVLLALLAFPQKLWRLARRFYRGRHEGEEEKYTRKLRRFTSQSHAHASFLREFARLCRARGLAVEWPPLPS